VRFHLPVCFANNLDLTARLPGMAINMRRGKIVGIIRAAERKRLAMLDFPRFTVRDLPRAQMANAACVSEYLCPALWGYGGAFSHSVIWQTQFHPVRRKHHVTMLMADPSAPILIHVPHASENFEHIAIDDDCQNERVIPDLGCRRNWLKRHHRNSGANGTSSFMSAFGKACFTACLNSAA
jgi:hypothetical protein